MEALDRQAECLDLLQMAGFPRRMVLEGRGEVAYIIGGPLGFGAGGFSEGRTLCSLFQDDISPHDDAGDSAGADIQGDKDNEKGSVS